MKPSSPVLLPEKTLLSNRGAWWVLVLIVLAGIFLRGQYLQVPLERDEGEFAYAGQLLLQGIPPFRLAYNMKLPGIYAAYGLIMALFGQTIQGIRIGLLLVNAGTTVLMFLLGRRLAGPLAGAGAAGVFSILSVGTSFLGPFGHATHFVLLPALGGVLLLQNGLGKERDWAFFGAGTCFGLAVLMKQPGSVFAFFGMGWWSYRRFVHDRDRFVARWREGAALLGGLLLPGLITVIWLAWAGVFDRFWFWVFDYARTYVGRIPFAVGIHKFQEAMTVHIVQAPLPWILVALGLVFLLVDRFQRSQAPFLLGYLVLSFLGVCPGLYFRQHYFILLLPAVGLLAGLGLLGLAQRLPGSPLLKTALPLVLLAAVFLQPVYAQREFIFGVNPASVSRVIYGPNPFPESVELARYIREHSSLEDKVAVIGSEPQIYFYSGRHSATGYIYIYGLMEPQPFAHTMQEEMAREIESNRPKFIVYVNVDYSWLIDPDSDEWIIQWSKKFLREHYDPAGVVDIVSPEVTEYRWEAEAVSRPPRSRHNIILFRRR